MAKFEDNLNINLNKNNNLFEINKVICFGDTGLYNNIIFNNNGFVTGFNDNEIDASISSDLSPQCCLQLGLTYDNDSAKCLWTPKCDVNDEFKIVINSQGEDGSIFQLEPQQECSLNVKFDWLFMFDCGKLSLPVQGVCNNQLKKEIAELTSQLNFCSGNTTQNVRTLNNKEKQIDVLRKQLESETNKNKAIALGKQLTLELTQKDSLERKIKKTSEDCKDVYIRLQNKLALCDLEKVCVTSEDEQVPYLKCIATRARLVLELEEYENILNFLLSNPDTPIEEIEQIRTLIFELKEGIETCVLPESRCNRPDPIKCFNGLNVFFTVEKVVEQTVDGLIIPQGVNLNFESPLTVESVYEKEIINIENLGEYLDGNENTGLLISGSSNSEEPERVCYDRIIKVILKQLTDLNQADTLQYDSFKSDWVTEDIIIDDENILNELNGQKLKFGLKVKSSTCDFSILLDNIEINKTCILTDTIEGVETIVRKAPGFNLKRVQDNKKSWVSKTEPENREFNLRYRETNYDTKNHKLVINSKEVDLEVNPATSIACDVMMYVNNNECLLSGASSGDTNISELITTPLDSITTVEEFEELLIQELIDVKSRLVLSDYPTLRLLYDRYIDPISNGCVVGSKKFNYETLFNFASLLGTYWVDLLEQVIPATTIWGASYRYRNTVFDTEKFKYKRYNLITCAQGSIYKESFDSNIGIKNDVEVILTDISDNEEEDNLRKSIPLLALENIRDRGDECNGVLITKISDSSEFMGTITVVGYTKEPYERFGGDDNNSRFIGEG